MAASLSLHICPVSTLGVPQKLQLALSPQGLHKWPGSFATAPQFLHVYAMMILLFSLIVKSALKNGSEITLRRNVFLSIYMALIMNQKI
jgi:hypothetical protein